MRSVKISLNERNENMMQRSSNTMVRNVLIGSVSIILLITVLYYMKRVEVGRLKKDMDSMVIQRSDREDELNRKLTEYLQKLEDMTRQLGDINSRLQECEDSKASVSMEVQKCKNVHSECLSGKETAEASMKAGQTELSRVKAEHESLNQRVNGHTQDMANLQHSLTDAEHELEQCEDSKDSCLNSLRETNQHIQQCQQSLSSCQASARPGGHQAFMQNPSNPQQPDGHPGGFPNAGDRFANPLGGGNPVGGANQQPPLNRVNGQQPAGQNMFDNPVGHQQV